MRDYLEEVIKWASENQLIRALVLVGSRAGREQAVDELSDYDLSVFSTNPRALIDNDSWIQLFGDICVFLSTTATINSARIPTRLVKYVDRPSIDFSIYHVSQINCLLSDGFLIDEYDIGYKPLLDKDDILSKLPPPRYRGFDCYRPTESMFLETVNEFWFEAWHVAKYLKRDDPWVVKFRDWTMKEMLLRMINWNARGRKKWNLTTGAVGKGIRRWADAEVVSQLEEVFGRFDVEDSWRSLFETMSVFSNLSANVAIMLKLPRSHPAEAKVRRFIEKLYNEHQKQS